MHPNCLTQNMGLLFFLFYLTLLYVWYQFLVVALF